MSNKVLRVPISSGAVISMDPQALAKARSRLRVASKALSDLESIKNYDDFIDIWYVLLTASKNFYTILEQGSKISAQSRQWYGAKKQERRSDPLLRYMYEARNDDEHGLNLGSEDVPGSLAIGVNKPGFSSAMSISGTFGPGGNLSVKSLDGKPVLVEQTLPHARLISVRDRSNVEYKPPTEHKGQPLESNLPLPVAKLMVAHLETMIVQAQALA
ncbi:hypothetical protein [Methylobacterium longum]|uniref:Uncharacterized protein n=1 Tax=Methylobacterium longum TaxID=767694 RepID=A0ABT8AQW7_9HYPH|nr:hypothetical protein [Methylobacterium longum]MDN3571820.1 hypothetical protein [Methylobacterium longum]